MRLRRDRLATPRDADLALDVHRQRDRPAQRDLFGRIAAHDGVLHREVRQRHVVALVAHHLHAAACQMRRQMVVRHRAFAKLVRDAIDHVLLVVEERQPTRLRLLDHRDLDAVDQRQAPALERCGDRLAAPIAGRRVLVVQQLSKARVALKHQVRAAPPLREPERPRAHRVLADAVAVVLDHLPRHRAGVRGIGELLVKARAGLFEPHLETVAVQDTQPFDLAVVVEGCLLRDGFAAQFTQADDPCGFEPVELAALPARVVVTLDRVDVVRGDELAPFAAEGGIVGEVDAGLDREDEVPEVGRHLGQRGRRVGPCLHRMREVLVLQRRLEDVRQYRVGIQIGHLHRVEAGLGRGERVAQHLGHRGGTLGGRGHCRGACDDERGDQHPQQGSDHLASCGARFAHGV